jgi:Protein of unknown function (DUF3224)
MGTEMTAVFEVKGWREEPIAEHGHVAKVTSARVARTYSGEIQGDSITEWVMAYAPDGSATFVGIERISGTMSGRRGSLVLRHVGSYRDGAAIAELTVVPDCGTGEFAGINGVGDFRADPKGKVHLELAFD